jgi:type I restriction enzyme S subunit
MFLDSWASSPKCFRLCIRVSKIAPFWSLADLVSEKVNPAAFQVSLEDMMSDTGRLVDDKEFSQYEAKGTPFLKGDVLFGKLRPYLAKYWLADRPGTSGGDIHVYRPAPDVEPRFLRYTIGSLDFVKYAEAASKGVKMPRVEWMGLREFGVYRPDRSEQLRIADYLDRETAEIDAMIATMDGLAGLLEERRTAEIDLALEHCTMTTIDHGWVVTDCLHKTAEFLDSGDKYVVSIGQLDGDFVDVSSAMRTTSEYFDAMREGGRAAVPGDAVMSRNASVGKIALVTENTPSFAMGQDVVLLHPRKCESSRLLAHVMASTKSQGALEFSMLGTTFKRINVAAIKKLPWPHLTQNEQKHITDHLDEVVSRIEQMLAKVAELKSLLTERRAALITDVVSGRKELA